MNDDNALLTPYTYFLNIFTSLSYILSNLSLSSLYFLDAAVKCILKSSNFSMLFIKFTFVIYFSSYLCRSEVMGLRLFFSSIWY